MKNVKWTLISCMVLLICTILPGVPAMASSTSVTTVTGTVPLTIYDINASGITNHTATISWNTNGKSTSQVFYDTKFHANVTDYAYHSSLDNASVMQHNVTLSGLLPSTTYHYRARSVATVDGTEFIAISDDNNFTTTGPTITVIYPNGGETWAVGTSQTITWDSVGVPGNVRIRLSRNGGTTWRTIIGSTPNDGSQAWTVTGPATTQARIKVISIANTTISDISDDNFTITRLSIRVISPNGGERWAVGSTQTIRWTSAGVTGNVSIELSRDGGSNWTTIVASTDNDGSQAWSVTGPATIQARIKVVSIANPAIFDISDRNFTITEPLPPHPWWWWWW